MAWIDPSELLTCADAQRRIAHDPPLDLAELASRSLSLAGALQSRGIRHAGLYFDDAAELATAMLACWRAGVCAVLPGDAQPSTCARLDAEVDIWLSDAALPAEAGKQVPLSALLEHPPLPAMRLATDAPGPKMLTSGSSGTPKIIDKQWPQLIEEVRALQAQWPASASPASTVVGSVSAQHMYGLPFRVLWPLCAGRPIVRRQLGYPEEVQQAIQAHAPCIWIASPALLRRLGDHLDWPMLRLGLKAIFSAGGPLPGSASQGLSQRLGLLPTEIYGSSETGVIAWRQGDTDWRAFPRVEVGTDERQALWVESPWIQGGREQTADAAILRGNGFALQGRLDRIIKLEEKRISLPMLESVLQSQPYVDEAYVDKPASAGRLTALVALTPAGIHFLRNQGRQALITALREHLARHVGALAIPRGWRFMRQLPWNAQGKMPRPVFERLAGPRPVTPDICPLPADDEATRRYALDIPLDLACFTGHFPQTPVVPGVAQIGWAYETARAHLQPGLNFGGLEILKFQKLLRPGDAAELTLRWDDSRAKLHFTIHVAGKPCSSGRILHRSNHVAP
jgi:acyl-coenzyme A synthetase/AMP-(fatty) acid ligase/3-hydroxymyristoyl/3-hydroxydecanoyl-(acyl carrier protein) dehydratase